MGSSEAANEEIRQLKSDVSNLRSETLQLKAKLDQGPEVSRRRGGFESFLSLVLLGRGLERAAIHWFDAINSNRREKRSEVPARETASFMVALLRMVFGSGVRGAMVGFVSGLLVAFPAWYFQWENNRILEEQTTRQTEEAAENRREQLLGVIYSEVAIGADGRCPQRNELRKRLEAVIELVAIERAWEKQIYLRDADLRCLNLNTLDLSGAVLTDADLRSANLTEADLRGAYLNGVKLDRAILNEADFSDSIGLEEQTLQNVRGRKYAHLPESLTKD